MFQKGQKLYSIFFNKCPRCHEGKFWPYPPYKNLFGNGGKLYETCSHCGLRYYREIGFWYGAMYVGYAVSIWFFMLCWGITSLLFPDEWSLWVQVGVICTALLLFMPVTYFVSRLIWINIFVKYEPGKREEFVDPAPKMSEDT